MSSRIKDARCAGEVSLSGKARRQASPIGREQLKPEHRSAKVAYPDICCVKLPLQTASELRPFNEVAAAIEAIKVRRDNMSVSDFLNHALFDMIG
jgi:hypothetical protein